MTNPPALSPRSYYHLLRGFPQQPGRFSEHPAQQLRPLRPFGRVPGLYFSRYRWYRLSQGRFCRSYYLSTSHSLAATCFHHLIQHNRISSSSLSVRRILLPGNGILTTRLTSRYECAGIASGTWNDLPGSAWCTVITTFPCACPSSR